MANLYTKTGDKGTTSLVGGSRVSKDDLRVECYGTVDEMGSALGMAKSLTQRDYVRDTLHHIQGLLFLLGAEIASDENGLAKLKRTISEDDVRYLEGVVDKCTETNGAQTAFVIPGENPPSGALHLARTIVRRCERNLIRLAAENQVRDTVLRFVNRLSDATYALARLEETLAQQEALRGRVEEEVRRQLGAKEERPPLTLEVAEKMAARAREKAKEIGVPMVIAVVDEGGNVIMLQRMANALLGSIDIALNKAFTAVAFQNSTDRLGADAQPGKSLYGIETSNGGRVVIFGGGFPYVYQGRIVGAVGVSGGTVEEDMCVARYALGE